MGKINLETSEGLSEIIPFLSIELSYFEKLINSLYKNMKGIKFTNSIGHEHVLNLSTISMIEKQTHQKSIVLYFGKEHMHINFKTTEERDSLFEKICDELEAS